MNFEMTTHQIARRTPVVVTNTNNNGLVECPLASLGRNTSAVLDSLTGGHHQPPYHHPLSSSPLDPQVYQMSRKSPDLSTDVDDIIYTSSVSQQGDTVDGLIDDLDDIEEDATAAAAAARNRVRGHLPEIYQLSHSSSQSSLERALPPQHKGVTAFDLRGRDNLHNGGARSAQYFLEKKMDALYLSNNASAMRTNNTVIGNGVRNGINGMPGSGVGGNGGSGGGGGGGGLSLPPNMKQCERSPYQQDERFYIDEGLRNICGYGNGVVSERVAEPRLLQHRTSSPSETSGSDRYLLNRTNSPANAFSSTNRLDNFSSSNRNTASSSSNLALDQHQHQHQQHHAQQQRNHHTHHHHTHPHSQQQRFLPPTKVKSLSDGLCNLGRFSPSLDQGYATLVSPSPTTGHHPTTITTHSIVHTHPHVHITAMNEHDNNTTSNTTITASTRRHPPLDAGGGPPPWRKKGPILAGPYFDRLPDEAILKLFNWLDSCELSNVARVCRRFEQLAWRPILWKFILLHGENLNGDKALKMIFRQLCGQSRNGSCPDVERVMLSDGCRISDKGLQLLTRRCPELTHLQIQLSVNVTQQALMDALTKCTNLQHLDVTGCSQISSISPNPNLDPTRRLLLQYLDLTDCMSLDDVGLKIVVKNCPQLIYLYLRRCVQITDAGIKFVPSFCIALKELSISDCVNITDFGLYELAKLGAALRYLSVAKCDRVSDAGLKVIARRCYKLRYLNARGCEAVSDDSITVLARSCPRLRALDIGKCDVSDAGLRALAECCPNLKKLSLRNCDMITDRGVQCIAYYCRGLQQLNIQDCQISIEGYRAVKKYCKRCIIEHTNPGFC